MPVAVPRLCIMLSGSGRTLVNLAEAIRRRELEATIDQVIASRECLGADKARALAIPTHILPGEIPAQKLEELLTHARIDLVVLAGYLKKVNIPHAYIGRVVNIHPALLPKHGGHGMYGDKVHAAVLAAGDSESGCTVHLVDEEYDRGPILLQRRVPVLPSDDVHALAARVFEQECLAYPIALKQLLATLQKGGGD